MRRRLERKARDYLYKNAHDVDGAMALIPFRDARTWQVSRRHATKLDSALSKMGFRLKLWSEAGLRRGLCVKCRYPHDYVYGKCRNGKDGAIKLPCKKCHSARSPRGK